MEFDICGTVKNIKQQVDDKGAVVLRNTYIDSIAKLSEFAKIFGDANVDMSCSAGPRKFMGENVFTSNEAPSDKLIPPHHEMAQCEHPPSYVIFFCITPPTSGGCTPIIKSSKVALHFQKHFLNYTSV